MILSWLALFFHLFYAFASEHQQGIGKYPILDYKKPQHAHLKIINGSTTSISKYPFVASLVHLENLFGAAVILNKRWLMTTGFSTSWVEASDLRFRVGSNFYFKKGQELKASQVIIHPKYNGSSWDYNIAVVKTNKPIKFNKKVQPIELGSEDLKGGVKGNVAGWGMNETEYTPSEVLLEGEVTVVDRKKCAKIYQSDFTRRLMCTFDKSVGPCVYDFGAPLVVNNTVYGLYAGGKDCTPGFYPVLYADVPSLVSWVKSVITSGEEDD